MGKNVTEYIGIAADEPKRLQRLNDRKISPIYDTDTRGGCWFCPNAKISSLSRLRKLHPDYWQELEALSHTPNLCSYGFRYGQTLQEVSAKIDKYDERQNIRERQLSLFPELEHY